MLLAAPAAPLPRSTLATCDSAPPWPCVPSAGVTLRVSTGAGLSSLTPDAQPAIRPAATSARKVVEVFNANMVVSFNLTGNKASHLVAGLRSATVGAPGGLAHIGPRRQQTRLDLAIEGGGHQYVAALRSRRIDDELAVGRKARAFVVGAVGQRLH